MKDLLPLHLTPVGKDCLVHDIKATGPQRRRILDLGFIKNTKVHVIRRSPLGDPTAYLIRDTMIALRNEEASEIIVKMEKEHCGWD